MIKKVFYHLTEGARCTMDIALLKKEWPTIKNRIPSGNGAPVLVLPGFLSNDLPTKYMRKLIDEKGYKSYGWEAGINLGMTDEIAAHVPGLLKRIFDENGGRKVILVGHSLGGVFARELAREYPEMIDKVITFGSPFGAYHDEIPPLLLNAFKKLHPKADTTLVNGEGMRSRRLTPPPVPTTSIYSETDGVVPWRTCINPQAVKAENIQITSSHIGMIYHPLALIALFDRMAQPSDQWQPFKANDYSNKYKSGPPLSDIPSNPQWKAKKPALRIFKK